MQTATAVHSAGMDPAQLRAVMADVIQLERARNYRRLFLARFSVLAIVLGIIGFGLRWMPLPASWVGLGACAIPPTWAWIVELRCDHQLSKRLNELPAGSTRVVPGVRKS